MTRPLQEGSLLVIITHLNQGCAYHQPGSTAPRNTVPELGRAGGRPPLGTGSQSASLPSTLRQGSLV